ncbi:chemotaxis protein CheA, partial [Acinetobacter baumannii]
MSNLRDRVAVWAKSEGKQARLVVEGRDVAIPPELARVLGGVLTHLARNAVAHGIEPPDERVRASKAATGSIEFVAQN